MAEEAERAGASVLPDWITAGAVRDVVCVELGLDGEWTSTARPIWVPGGGLNLAGATMRHPLRRPAIEIRLRDGWIGLLAAASGVDGYVTDESFLRRVIAQVASGAGRPERP
jgi:hypothetical protein